MTKNSFSFMLVVRRIFMMLRNKAFPALKRSKLCRFLVLWFAPLLILENSLLMQVLRSNNHLEVFPRNLPFPVLQHTFTALLIALIIYFSKYPKSLGAKMAAASILGLFMVNYNDRLDQIANLFRSLIPLLPENGNDLAYISLLFIIVLILLSITIGMVVDRVIKKHKSLTSQSVALGILIIFGFVFASQAIRFAQLFPSMLRQSHTTVAEFQKPANKTIKDKPDIYYIVLDRYTNNTVLKDQFSYDNSNFTNFLRTNGFYINDTAQANYPYTAPSIASTMSANYTNKSTRPYQKAPLQSRTLYHNLIWQSPVTKALKDHGYTYHHIGSWYGATNRAPLADSDYMWDFRLNILGREKRLRGIEAHQFEKSPFHQLTKLSNASWWPFKSERRSQIENVREQLYILESLSKQPPGGRFIFAHILVPHDPFYFNSDGSLANNPSVDSVGKHVKDKYINQVRFINEQLKEIITSINKQSSEQAIILLNADEGPYPDIMNDTFKKPALGISDPELAGGAQDMRTWPSDWTEMKFGILQAIHIPKATEEDMQYLNSVNLFRIVLNRHLGYNLEYLPNCQFLLTKGNNRMFTYSNVTADPVCKAYEN